MTTRAEVGRFEDSGALAQSFARARASASGCRGVALLGAASNIGIRPYDDGRPRQLDRAPAALRRQRLTARLRADDRGDLRPQPYRDLVRSPGRVRNESEVLDFSHALASEIAGMPREQFLLVLGGDCSIVLGNLLGLRRGGFERVGLVYLDAHADFATPAESASGSAASMCLALAAGRGESALAHLLGASPLVAASDIALVGRRDQAQTCYGQNALAPAGVLDLPGEALAAAGAEAVARRALERVARPEIDGFWIHLDADLIDPLELPAVDSPEPGGPGLREVAALVGALVRHPKALGLELTIYDPALDSGDESAGRLADLLVDTLSERVWP